MKRLRSFFRYAAEDLGEQLDKRWRLGALAVIAGITYFARGDTTAVNVDIQLQTFVTMLAAAMLIRRKVSIWVVATALWLTIGFESMALFETVIHPFLIDHKLYPDFMGYGNTVNQSNQYAKILIAYILCAAMGLLVWSKRWRTFDRLMVTLVFGSVLATSLLFHWVSRQWVEEAKSMQAVTLRLAAEAPPQYFKPICREIKADCYTGNRTSPEVKTGNLEIDARIADLRARLPKEKVGLTYTSASFTPFVNEGTVGNRLRVAHFAFHQQYDDTFRIVVEGTMMRRLLVNGMFLYGLIATAAHSTWIFGGLFLIWWHRRRFVKRHTEMHNLNESQYRAWDEVLELEEDLKAERAAAAGGAKPQDADD